MYYRVLYLKRTNNTHEALCCWRSTSNANHTVTSTEVPRYHEIDVPSQAPTSLRSTPNVYQTETPTGVPAYQELHLPRSTPNEDRAETPTNVHRYQELHLPSQSPTSLRSTPNADRVETPTPGAWSTESRTYIYKHITNMT